MKLLAPIKNDEDIVNKKYVDSIDIGSRNIATGTANMVIGSGKWEKGHWRQSGTGTIETIDITETIVPSVNKGAKLTATSTGQIGICQDLIPLNNNNIYTLSCWVRGSSSGLTCRLQPFYASSTDTGGIKSFTLTGEWQYLNYTANKPPQNTTNYSGAYIYLIPNASGDTLEVCGIKLERGDKATDWNPAPEDLAPVVHTHDVATQSTNGFLSASDKTILDNLNTLVGDTSVSTQISSATKDCITGLSVSGTTVTYTKKDGSTGTITTQDNDTHYKTGLKVGASATATTNAAATNGNVYLNVLDDSTVRDSHNIIGSGSTTVTSDANGKIIINSTDTKVNVTPVDDESAKSYYPTFYASTSGTSVTLNSSDDYNIVTIEGTEESAGYTVLRLGNIISSGTSGNKYGQLTLYSKSSGYSAIRAADTTEVVSHMLPAISGTILNTGTTSFTRSLTSGTKIGSIKINNTNTDIYAPTNTDTKVTAVENHYTPSADSSAALSTSASGATAAWNIDVVKGVTLQRDAKGHVTGVSVTSGKIPANPNTDTKVTQTVTTSNASYPLLLAPSGQTATTTTTSYFDSGVTLNPSTNTIAANISGNAASATKATQDSAGQQINTTYIKDLSISGTNLNYTKGDSTVSTVIVNDLLSGSALKSNGTTATTTKGYSYGVAGVTTSPYNYTKWYAYLDSGITTLTNGMIIKMRIPVAGCNYGTCIAINGSDFHPVVFNTNSVVTTHYGVGVELLLMYDSNGSAKVCSNSATATAISGVWRVMNNYNSNTTNTAGSTNTASKIFLVGTTSQTNYAQTYSNSRVYTENGTLILSKTTDASGTANNSPALIVGGTSTQPHLEFDANEIMAKKDGTTVAGLTLNAQGGNVYIGQDGTGTLIGICQNVTIGTISNVGPGQSSGTSILLPYARTKALIEVWIGAGSRKIVYLTDLSNSMTSISAKTILGSSTTYYVKYSIAANGVITITLINNQPSSTSTVYSVNYMVTHFN